jgi:hypothetical protein
LGRCPPSSRCSPSSSSGKRCCQRFPKSGHMRWVHRGRPHFPSPLTSTGARITTEGGKDRLSQAPLVPPLECL